MVDADLLAAEWNVEAVVRLVDLAGSEAAVVVGTADEQGLSVGSATAENGIAGHIAMAVVHPSVSVSGQQLVVVLHNLTASVGHIGTAFVGDHLWWISREIKWDATEQI